MQKPIREAIALDIMLVRLIEQLNEEQDLERGDRIIVALTQAGLMHRLDIDVPSQRYILLPERSPRVGPA